MFNIPIINRGEIWVKKFTSRDGAIKASSFRVAFFSFTVFLSRPFGIQSLQISHLQQLRAK